MPFADLPVPYLQIDKEFTILSASREAKDLFPEATSFLDLIDLASVRKTVQFLTPKHPKTKLEVHMHTQTTSIGLFELRILWDAAERGHIVCIEQKEQLELTAGIAYEIRNPLTIIRGFVQLLSPQLEEIGRSAYAKVVLTEIDRVNEIIHQFLSTAKPMEPIKQKISVTKLHNRKQHRHTKNAGKQ